MTRPRLLDLFCGPDGGAAAGYIAAGFDVTGVDIAPEHAYPGTFIQTDALDYLAAHWQEYEAVHASPPCHDHTPLVNQSGEDGSGWLLPATLTALAELPIPWVVENVAAAPMPGALILCGSEFGLSVVCNDGKRRWLRRHRQFLSSFPLWGAGGCGCTGRPIIGVYGNGGGGKMTRGYKATPSEARELMRMPWASQRGMSLAIPPAYGQFIGEQIRAELGEVAA